MNVLVVYAHPEPAYKQRLLALDTIPHLFFHPAEDYGPNERPKPGVLARSGVQRNV